MKYEKSNESVSVHASVTDTNDTLAKMLASVDQIVFKHTGEDLRNAVASDLKQRYNAKLKAFIASARTVEKAKTYDDFDWEKLIITNELRENLYVSQLDLFLMPNFTESFKE